MIQSDALQNSVNLFTGSSGFPVNLITRPGRNGLNLDLSIFYNSQVRQTVTTWNLDAPTGVLGLGWTLPFETIVVDRQNSANLSDDTFYLLGGETSSLLVRTGTDTDGSWIFETRNYSFWKILYNPTQELWTIVRENGDTYLYGNLKSVNNSLQWGIAWDNWIDSSTQTKGQSAIVLAWNLNAITNRWGDRIEFHYEIVSQDVKPHSQTENPPFSYTQAAYLSKVIGVTGESLSFNYGEKEADEYQDPHTNPSAPNAYQSRYETRYLQSITVKSATNTLLETVKFGYQDAAGGTAFIGQGKLKKRLLTSIYRENPGGYTLPAYKFTYYGQNSTDGVDATNIYNRTTHALYGAINTVTLPEGGTITYHYSEQTLGLSSRNRTMEQPSKSGVTYSQPRFAFASDYTVVLWYGSDNTLNVRAYTWDGRWLFKDLGSMAVTNANAYNAAVLLAVDGFFAIQNSQHIYLYHQNPNQAGEWIQPQVGSGQNMVNYFTTDFAVGEPTQVVAGDRYLGVLGQTSGKLFRYRWNGVTWADDSVQLSAGASPARFAATAKYNLLTVLGTAEVETSDPMHISLFVLDELGTWQAYGFSRTRLVAGLTGLNLYAGPTFVVEESMSTTGEVTESQYRVFWWNRDFTELFSYNLGKVGTSQNGSAPVIHGSTIALGQVVFRFDGLCWQTKNLTEINYTNVQALRSISYGYDRVLRVWQNSAPNTYTYDLVAYDPNTGSWSVPPGMSTTGTNGEVGAIAPRTHNAPSNFVLFNNKVYYWNPDGSFSDQLTIPNPPTGSDLASLQLLASRYLIYQNGADTFIYTLKNGGIANTQAAITLTGNKIYIDGHPPETLVGLNAFVTYTGTFDTPGSVLNLHRVVTEATSGNQNGYGVTGILVNDGYQTVTTGYQYDKANATVGAFGYIPQFNKVTTIQGSEAANFNTYGYTETYFFNGLTPDETPALLFPSGTNTQEYYSLVKGMMYAEQVFDHGGTKQSSVEKYWQIFTKSLGQNGNGTYTRLIKDVPMLDNVISPITYSYAAETGLVIRIRSQNYNCAGIQEFLVQEFKYWWEEYNRVRTLNLLAPIIQTTEKTEVTGQAPEVTAISVTTWKEEWGHGPGQWAPWQSFEALSAGATFTDWNGSRAPGSDWLNTHRVLARTATGLVAKNTNVDGVVASTIYGKSGWLPVARFNHCDTSAQEGNYYDFEPYETDQGWGFSSSNGTLTENITTLDYHTGTRSLKLSAFPGQKIGPIRQFQPNSQDRSYVFSSWVKSESGFDPVNGQARWEINIYRVDTGAQVGTTMNLDIGNTKNQWIYVQQTIDLVSLRNGLPTNVNLNNVNLNIVIRAYNQNTNKYTLVDNLRFSPVNGTFAATVYDPDSLRTSATLSNNGETIGYLYDSYQRLIAQVGPQEKVKSLIVPALSRTLTSSDRFVPDFPNSVLRLVTTSDSVYYDFHDGNTSDWSFTDGPWNITGGQLTYSPPNPPSNHPLGGTATLNLFAFTNFAVRVVVETDDGGTAGIGNGDLFVYWDGNAKLWRLAQMENGQLQNKAESHGIGFGENWVLVIIEGFAMFYVNGIQLFCYQYRRNAAAANIGKPVLTLKQAGAFDDLIVLNNPQLGVSFLSGIGSVIQAVGYQGYDTIPTGNYPADGSGTFLDALGRPEYERNPLTSSLKIASPGVGENNNQAALLEGNQGTYLVDPQGQPLTKQNYLDGASGVYDYTTIHYETSPLSRITAQIMPREKNADATQFTVSYDYMSNTAAGDGSVMKDLLPSGSQKHYYLEKVTDQNGVPTYILTDQAGNMIARRTLLENGSYQTTFYEYNGAGLLTTLKQPNYFNPPDGSQASDWTESQTYDFRKLLISRTTPDSHTTQFIYDNADRPRFILDANGAAQIPQRILYIQYDKLGRETERGYIQDSNYQWGTNGAALKAKANNQEWPHPEDNTSPNYAAGKWYQRFIYDTDSNRPTEKNLLGRLAIVQINNNPSGADVETYSYDSSGNIVQKTNKVVNFGSETYLTDYKYDNLDRVIKITYPHVAGGQKFQVGYYYNRLGQLASVGDPLTGTEVIDPSHLADAGEKYYAAYTYDPMGNITTESLNNGKGNPQGQVSPNSFNRLFSYNFQGWLESMDDPYFNQTLSYYGDSQPNPRYNGNITGIQNTFKPDKWSSPPTNFKYDYAYDHLSRLTSANNNQNNAWTFSFGYDNQAGYDNNGNIVRLQRGLTKEVYSYRETASKPPQNNQVSKVSTTVNNSLNFETLTTSPTCASGWCWGSNNGGPSMSAVVDDGQQGKVLKLAGGSLGHYERLKLSTYLDPNGTYSLSYKIKTSAGFSQGYGQAGWYVGFYTDTGQILSILVAAVEDTSENWSQMSQPINLPALRSDLGLNEDLNYVTLECINYLIPASGSDTGPDIYLDEVSLTSTQTVENVTFQYDTNGNVTQSLSLEIDRIAYDPVTQLTASIAMSNGYSLTYNYGGNNRRTWAKCQDSGNKELSSLLYLHGTNDLPLMEILKQSGQADVVTYYIYGSRGKMIAYKGGDNVFYLISDHLGSVRGVVNGESGQITASYDYLPFGGSMRTSSNSSIPYRYTGQEFDAVSGLYNYRARMYDPQLGRFFAPDPASQFPSPYSYTGNNPVNFIDPSGRISCRTIVGWSLGLAVLGLSVILHRRTWLSSGSYKPKPPQDELQKVDAELQQIRQDLRIEPQDVKRGSVLDDFLKWRSYDLNNYAAFRFTNTTSDGRPLGKDGQLLKQGWYIYTLDTNHEFRYLPTICLNKSFEADGRGKYGFEQIRNHSQLGGGAPIFAAGWFKIDQNGQVITIDSASGHYKPQGISALYAVYVLQKVYGLNISPVAEPGMEEVYVFTFDPNDIYQSAPQPGWGEVLRNDLLNKNWFELAKINFRALEYRYSYQPGKTPKGEYFLNMANDPEDYYPW